EAITAHAFGGKVFFCHSGAEANEAALKLVRLGAGEGRYKIISFAQCFHGRTMGALSLTPAKFQKGFEPMLPGGVTVGFGDLSAVEKAIDAETAAVIVEPFQAEGGMNVPAEAFMKGLRRLCDQHKLMLICDEVWTAPARTGRWFAHQHYDIVPDVMTLGKAIGGGLPVGACVAAPKWQDVLQPGTHGCTGGGNPLCAAAGAAAMKLIEAEGLVERAATTGAEVMQTLRDAKVPCVREVRGAGLMIGIELDKPGKQVFLDCLKRGLYINCTQETVLRLAPALTTAEEDLSRGLDILLGVLRA
ncbi:MAG TPA: aminotransferase class III-fold pyridoxal phosphate-dependent enzyme, partial [Phycisphaerae bacterium]|nr:aminotransferase class III-fold pyridoxal phosphate-dependent enzyme [Phycisphaerae bacterium]